MRVTILLSTIWAFSLACSAAHAGFVMIVDDPSTQEIDMRIEDGGANDQSSLPGVIAFSGDMGGLSVGTTTGLNRNAADDPRNQLELNVSFVRVPAGSAGGTVDFMLTDTDFDIGPSTATATYNGSTIGGFFNFDFYGDSSNGEFVNGFEIFSTGGAGLTGVFDESVTESAPSVGSLTIGGRAELRSITETGGFAANVSLVPIPEPTTMVLLALALLGRCIAPLRVRRD